MAIEIKLKGKQVSLILRDSPQYSNRFSEILLSGYLTEFKSHHDQFVKVVTYGYYRPELATSAAPGNFRQVPLNNTMVRPKTCARNSVDGFHSVSEFALVLRGESHHDRVFKRRDLLQKKKNDRAEMWKLS